jgi:3-oxoadipate enol-lactonase / 4-carboxymuconolactone decarboxylase
MWERQAPALAAAGYRAITCDLPGHGAAERPARTGTVYTTAELATSLLGVMDEAGIDRGVLVGFSLGGGVALQVALDRPARVSALALIDTTAWPGPDAAAASAGAPPAWRPRASASSSSRSSSAGSLRSSWPRIPSCRGCAPP